MNYLLTNDQYNLLYNFEHHIFDIMKLNVGDTIILSLGIGSSLGFIYFLFHGWYADSYFPGMFALGFFLWFLYRKGENFQENRKR